MIEIKITNGDEVKEIAGESAVVFLENPKDEDKGMSVVVMGKGNLFKLIDNVMSSTGSVVRAYADVPEHLSTLALIYSKTLTDSILDTDSDDEVIEKRIKNIEEED